MRMLCFLFTLLALPLMPVAYAAEAEDFSDGMRIFQQKANCQGCHGWAGDGRKMDNQMPTGANLRESKIDRAALVMVIKCGLPGTGMPPFDRLAYTDARCFGKTKADLSASGVRMSDPPATLQPREVELLADFIVAKILGKGAMTRAACVDYWSGDAEPCRELK